MYIALSVLNPMVQVYKWNYHHSGRYIHSLEYACIFNLILLLWRSKISIHAWALNWQTTMSVRLIIQSVLYCQKTLISTHVITVMGGDSVQDVTMYIIIMYTHTHTYTIVWGLVLNLYCIVLSLNINIAENTHLHTCNHYNGRGLRAGSLIYVTCT